jgi:hypothetical protein
VIVLGCCRPEPDSARPIVTRQAAKRDPGIAASAGTAGFHARWRSSIPTGVRHATQTAFSGYRAVYDGRERSGIRARPRGGGANRLYARHWQRSSGRRSIHPHHRHWHRFGKRKSHSQSAGRSRHVYSGQIRHRGVPQRPAGRRSGPPGFPGKGRQMIELA